MTLIPRSIVGRTLSVLIAGLLLSQLIGIGMFWGERRDAVAENRSRVLASQVIEIAKEVSAVTPPERYGLAKRFSRPGLTVFMSDEHEIEHSSRLRWMFSPLRRYLERPLSELGLRKFKIGFFDDDHFKHDDDDDHDRFDGRERRRRMMENWPHERWGRSDRRFDRPDHGLAVVIKLDDGNWLHVVAPVFGEKPFFFSKFFGSLILMILVACGISIWALRRATQPLDYFAKAAERLGLDVNANPLPEEGPKEVKKAAKAFNEMQHRLRRFVQDRTHMLAAISHDLRTPITRMKLRAEFVEDEEQREKMLKDLDEMEAMISATLSFARDDAASEPAKVIDIASLAQSLCDDQRDQGNEVSYDGPDKVTFLGRPIALKRALSNLIGNAIKYGGDAAVILKAEDHTLSIQVCDSGPGLAPELLEKVFDPFYRVEGSRSRETGGTGLGLAVVRSVARAHGGEAYMKNRQGGGLCAELRLPIREE